MEGIVFAGSLIVDHIKAIQTLPERSELAKITEVKQSTGGCVCNTAIDLAILDCSIPISAVGVAGEDDDAQVIVQALKNHNIDTSQIIHRGTTSFTDVYAEESTQTRTFFQYPGASGTFDVEDVDVDNLQCKIFHIGYVLLLDRLDEADEQYGTRLAQLLCKIHQRGIKTSIDVVSETSNRYKTVVVPALKYVDYLTFNEIEAEKTTGVKLRQGENLLCDNMIIALRKLMEYGVKNRVIIHCVEGAFGLDSEGNYLFTPSNTLPKGYVVGTVGAGDAFCAGTLLASYYDLPLATALEYGNASAQVSLRSASASGSMCDISSALAERQVYKSK